ncbi:MAG: four helix bundle protein [Desulfovibrionales bacterium]
MVQRFGFEDLNVWKKAVAFGVEVINLVEKIETSRKHFRLLEQIESSATSVAMNIAEGKGRFSKKEFRQYCYVARGSLYETITLLIIMQNMNWISGEDYKQIEEQGIEIAAMIKGLIKTLN